VHYRLFVYKVFAFRCNVTVECASDFTADPNVIGIQTNIIAIADCCTRVII